MEQRIKLDSCPLCKSNSFENIESADCSSHPLYSPEIEPLMQWTKRWREETFVRVKTVSLLF